MAGMHPRGPPQMHPYAQPGAHGHPGQPAPFAPPQTYAQPANPYAQHAQSYGMPAAQDPFLPADPLMAMGTNMLRQSGATYLESGKKYMQSWTGFLSGGLLHYQFNIDAEYVRSKLLVLLAPFLRKQTWTRQLEQITGGHKYLPPRMDVYAPDLYIPFMAVCTYCLLASITKLLGGRFTPDTMYATVSEAFIAWALQFAVLKGLLYTMGASSAVPWLEAAAYAGYPFVSTCVTMIVRMTLGGWASLVAWGYAALVTGFVLPRMVSSVVIFEARNQNVDDSRLKLLAALFLIQLPFIWVMVKLP